MSIARATPDAYFDERTLAPADTADATVGHADTVAVARQGGWIAGIGHWCCFVPCRERRNPKRLPSI